MSAPGTDSAFPLEGVYRAVAGTPRQRPREGEPAALAEGDRGVGCGSNVPEDECTQPAERSRGMDEWAEEHDSRLIGHEPPKTHQKLDTSRCRTNAEWLSERKTMSENSKIEWTDATWNPVRGCTKISPGCAHCYASTFAERFRGVPGSPFEQGFDLRLVPEKLPQPLEFARPRLIFVNSMSDLFHDGVPDEYIEQVARVMMASRWHT